MRSAASTYSTVIPQIVNIIEPGKGHEAKNSCERQVGNDQRQHNQRARGRPAAGCRAGCGKWPSCPDDERDRQFGEQRLDEPAGAEQLRRGVKHEQERPNVRKSNTELSTPNSTMKRPMKRMSQRRGPFDQLGIDAVVRDADRGDVREKVVQQDLAGQRAAETAATATRPPC